MTLKENQKQTICGKAAHYVRALSRWIKSGRPVRSSEEIRCIFNRYCVSCERYESKNGTCQCCGCKVNLGEVPLTNKIAMGTEKCPLEKW